MFHFHPVVLLPSGEDW